VNKTDETAMQVAKLLLQIKAVKLQPTQPFTWASGWRSPIYCDNRLTLGHPAIRTYLRQQLSSLIQTRFSDPNLIAGVATAGIPQGVLVAQELGLPFCYVRPEPKSHGLGNLIEGPTSEGQSVVVVEDLVSTGGSSLRAVQALRNAGLEVKGLACIFTYSFKVADDAFEHTKLPMAPLCTYNTLIQQAIEDGYVREEDLATLNEWRENPAEWGK